MTFVHFSLLLGSAAFFYLGYQQFYLRKNVDQLQRQGRLTAEGAARIRRKPMRLIGWICIAAGIMFGILAFLGS